MTTTANSYTVKHLSGVAHLQFKKFNPSSLWQGVWQDAGRHGAGVVI